MKIYRKMVGSKRKRIFFQGIQRQKKSKMFYYGIHWKTFLPPNSLKKNSKIFDEIFSENSKKLKKSIFFCHIKKGDHKGKDISAIFSGKSDMTFCWPIIFCKNKDQKIVKLIIY